MTNIASISDTITGTADGDILIGLDNGSSGATTIDGGAGNDVIFGDHNTLIADTVQFNNSIANAFNLDPSGQWSTFENPDVGDTAIPYTTALGTGANQLDFFSVTIGAGETITIDGDWGNSSAGGNAFDGFVRLLDASGAVVTTDDDSPFLDGGLGSTLDLNGSNSRDPLLTTTVATAGTYYIEFGRYLDGTNTGALLTGDTYTLNVSVTGHAATGVPQSGNDSLVGGLGDDVIYGMAGNDFIDGGADNDRVYGGSGNDTLSGGAGDDLLDGGAGNDLFFAAAGADTMLGGAGQDQLSLFSSLDISGQVFDGGADFDLLTVTKLGGIGTVDLRDDTVTGIEQLFLFDNASGPSFVVDDVEMYAAQFADFTKLDASGHAGQTVTLSLFMDTETTLDLSGLTVTGFTEPGDGIVITGDGDNETITGSEVNDTINAGGGDDIINGGAGSDSLSGGDDNDTLNGGGGVDTLNGGNGDDTFIVDNNNLDIIDGGTGVNTLDATGLTGHFLTVTSLYAGSAYSVSGLSGTLANIDVVLGSEQGDQITTQNISNKAIHGNGGDDVLLGGGGSQTIYGGAGDDTIDGGFYVGSGVGDLLEGGLGNDNITGANGDDTIFGGDDNDSITANNGNDTIDGGTGNDTIEGGEGADLIEGGAGDDELREENIGLANDTMNGGAGNDTLWASFGADILDGGDDIDTLQIAGTVVGTLSFNIDLLTGTDTLGNTYANIENVNAGQGNDTVFGDGENNAIDGGAGNDSLLGGGGTDNLFGGLGNDTLDGTNGSGAFVFGNNDTLDGGAGDDLLIYSMNDTSSGSIQTFDGGGDTDTLSFTSAGFVPSTFVDGIVNLAMSEFTNFGQFRGSIANIENVTVANGLAVVGDDNANVITGIGEFDNEFTGGGGNDTINSGAGNDNVYSGSGADVVDLGDGDDYVRVGGGQESFDGGSGTDYISYYYSSNGITANLAENTISGSWAANDTINSFESISGSRTGDDEITGTSGANIIKTYGGDDRVYAGGGTDVVELGGGNDYVRVGGGVESFDGGNGVDYISYYDSSNGITANLAANTISGSWAVNDSINSFEGISGSRTGDDEITGTSGANIIKTYGGNDRVYAGGGSDDVQLGSGNDYVRVGGGVESFDGGSGTDYISYYDSANGITIDFATDTVSGSWAVNDTVINFEGGSGSNTGNDKMYGNSGENTLKGFGGDDSLYGRSGDDKLYGGNGEDRFDGGGGMDLLYGGGGADTFHFDHGEDHDIIKDFENNIDVIELDNFTFGAGEDAFDYATQVGDDVVFDFGGGDMLTVEDVTIGQLVNDLEMV